MQTLLISPRLSSFLDLARWVSALSVATCHLAHLIIDHNSLANSQSWLLYGLFIIRNFHIPSVMIFFVLSGYLVGGPSVILVRQRRFDIRKYLINRFSRLYPVLLVALALGALWDVVGLTWFNAEGFTMTTLLFLISTIPTFPKPLIGGLA